MRSEPLGRNGGGRRCGATGCPLANRTGYVGHSRLARAQFFPGIDGPVGFARGSAEHRNESVDDRSQSEERQGGVRGSIGDHIVIGTHTKLRRDRGPMRGDRDFTFLRGSGETRDLAD